MKEKTYKQVHTTIPEKYWNFAKKQNLSWAELLTKAIEQKILEKSEVIRDKLDENNEERERLLKKLKEAENKETNSKQSITGVHRGLMPVD